ncbi:MAG: hypothetical protein B7X12_00590 [Halothiobacillus sp. 20-53-49]|nr:MAG: hypothetical protein B7X12_00590 [Halothiobacillus sp. 20-53-49]
MQPYFSLPQRQAILLIALNGLLWTFIPWFTNHNLPLDVVEQLTWGHEWQWGYYKHPFLPAWMAEVFYRVWGGFGLYFLSQLAIGVTLLFVYLIGERLMDRHRALLGTLLTLGIYYFIWPTPEWNNNIAQMPFWAAAVYFLLRALQGNKAQDWSWIGLALGMGVLTKYSTGILALTFFPCLLCFRRMRFGLCSMTFCPSPTQQIVRSVRKKPVRSICCWACASWGCNCWISCRWFCCLGLAG